MVTHNAPLHGGRHVAVALQLTTFRQLRLSLPATRNARAAGVDTFSVPQSAVKGGEKVYRCGGSGTADYTLPPEIVNGKGYWVWSDEPSTLVT